MPEQIKVGDNEWRVAKPDTHLFTKGMNVCVGIVVYDPLAKEAILGHWALISTLQEHHQKMLSDFVANRDVSSLRGYLRGISPWRGDFVDLEAGEKRVLAVDLLRQIGLQKSQIRAKWNPHAHDVTQMGIYTNSGCFRSKTERSNAFGKSFI